MEIALCVIDSKRQKLQYSGAFLPLYIIRDCQLYEYKGDSMPIGIYETEDQSFTNHEINFQTNDMIYMFSDGYIDQLGGVNRKTFRSGNFKKLLINIHQMPVYEQKVILEEKLDEWRGNIEQIDDILVAGLRM
jgi:serine phosphatase RsbU (regulator of sigma subunit)